MQQERKRERRKNAEGTQRERRNAVRAMGMQKERKAGRSKNAATGPTSEKGTLRHGKFFFPYVCIYIYITATSS